MTGVAAATGGGERSIRERRRRSSWFATRGSIVVIEEIRETAYKVSD